VTKDTSALSFHSFTVVTLFSFFFMYQMKLY